MAAAEAAGRGLTEGWVTGVNLYGRLLSLIGVVLAGILALALIGLAAGGETLTAHFYLTALRFTGPWIGRGFLAFLGVAIMFAVAYLIMRTLGVGASKVLAFESSSGHMEVDISALEACLTRTALDVDDVIDAKAKIRVQPGGLAKPIICAVQVGLRERADVPGRGSEIGAKIRERFLEIIPIDTPPVVNLNIRIRSAKRPAPPAEPEYALPPAADEHEEEPDQELEDTPDFTGERDYGEGEESEGGKEEASE